jgi:hypothetical protein
VTYCDVEDCLKPAERVQEDGRALCATHRKQIRRSGRITPVPDKPESQHDRLFRAAIDLRDADSEDDVAYTLAERRFWNAFRAAAREHVLEHPEVIEDLVSRFLSPSAPKMRRR